MRRRQVAARESHAFERRGIADLERTLDGSE